MKQLLVSAVFACLTLLSCNVDGLPDEQNIILKSIEVPTYFPDIPFPSDNSFTTDRWLLGRKLFFDKRLSVDESISCASCHNQTFAFAGNTTTSDGVMARPGTRNVPSLSNIAFHPYYTREGGLPSLEVQVLVPIQEHNEFDFNMVSIIERLSADANYQEMAMKAYGRELDAFVLVRAIATFERSFISANSRYDSYFYKNIPEAMTLDEIRGKELFYSDKTNCSKCHNGFDLTSYEFGNNGLYEEYKDVGRYRLTQKAEDLAMFKIPSLRNVEFTSPYMHDGSMTSLEKVIDHYNTGGKNHVNKSGLIKPLGLSIEDKQRLIAFLKTMSDEKFIKNEAFKNKN